MDNYKNIHVLKEEPQRSSEEKESTIREMRRLSPRSGQEVEFPEKVLFWLRVERRAATNWGADACCEGGRIGWGMGRPGVGSNVHTGKTVSEEGWGTPGQGMFKG